MKKFRNEIIENLVTLRTISYEKPKGEFLGAPTLEGSTSEEGDDALLEWERPDGDITVYGYELFVDGVFYENVGQVTSYLYENMDFSVQYDFKVRAIGPVGIKSPFSNTITLEGGGAPVLFPAVWDEYKGTSIEWQDISDNTHYTIEGYNVYVEAGDYADDSSFGTPINDSPLGLSFIKYSDLGLLEDTTYSVGVSYLYDGGTESEIFFQTIQTRKAGFKYDITSWNDPPVSIVSGEDGNAAIVVENGTEVGLRCYTPASYFQHLKSWVSIYFNGTWETYFELEGNGKKPLTFIVSEGCDPGNFTRELFGDRNFKGNIQAEMVLSGGWSRSFYWTVSGGCSAPTRTKQTWEMFVENSSETVLEDNIDDYMNNDRLNFEMYKIQEQNQRLTAITQGDGNVNFRIKRHIGLPFHDLYIKSDSDSSYGTPYTSSPIENWLAGGYSVTDLSAGTYNAKVEYLLMDETTVLDETNEVTFTLE